jgi:hypothetical protein
VAMTKIFDNIGWELLRKQKQVLIRLTYDGKNTFEERETIIGIVNLLDEFQDTAVEEGYATVMEVFGDDVQ